MGVFQSSVTQEFSKTKILVLPPLGISMDGFTISRLVSNFNEFSRNLGLKESQVTGKFSFWCVTVLILPSYRLASVQS